MGTSAGTVDIGFEGDASGAEAAGKKTVEVVDKVKGAVADAAKTTASAAPQFSIFGAEISKQALKGAEQFSKMRGAIMGAASSMSGLPPIAQQVGNTIQGAFNAFAVGGGVAAGITGVIGLLGVALAKLDEWRVKQAFLANTGNIVFSNTQDMAIALERQAKAQVAQNEVDAARRANNPHRAAELQAAMAMGPAVMALDSASQSRDPGVRAAAENGFKAMTVYTKAIIANADATEAARKQEEALEAARFAAAEAMKKAQAEYARGASTLGQVAGVSAFARLESADTPTRSISSVMRGDVSEFDGGLTAASSAAAREARRAQLEMDLAAYQAGLAYVKDINQARFDLIATHNETLTVLSKGLLDLGGSVFKGGVSASSLGTVLGTAAGGPIGATVGGIVGDALDAVGGLIAGTIGKLVSESPQAKAVGAAAPGILGGAVGAGAAALALGPIGALLSPLILPLGELAAVLFVLSTTTREFNNLTMVSNTIMGDLVAPLGALWAAFEPLIGSAVLLGSAFAPLAEVLIALVPLTPVVNVLVQGMVAAATAIAGVAVFGANILVALDVARQVVLQVADFIVRSVMGIPAVTGLIMGAMGVWGLAMSYMTPLLTELASAVGFVLNSIMLAVRTFASWVGGLINKLEDILGIDIKGEGAAFDIRDAADKAMEKSKDAGKPGAGQQAFEDRLKELTDGVKGNADASKDNTTALESFNREFKNLPTGVKVAGREFASADAVMRFNVSIANWHSLGNVHDDFEALRDLASGRGRMPRRGGRGNRN